MDALKFVIVGHVDHGKSTLIGRLLYDTDSLPHDKIEEIRKTSNDLGREIEFAYLLDHFEEERQQGITIDTTQVFFKSPNREYIIIDAPGHVEFVKNMFTGASQAEAAVLIIGVNEGVKEQTKRHSYILSMLGLNQIVVVINKMDLIDYKEDVFQKVRSETEFFLNTINIRPSYYIPISAYTGENIVSKSENLGWYDGPTFLECMDKFKKFDTANNRSLLFPVQDVYKIEDKRIIVGRIESGSLREGQRIKIVPSQEQTSICSIEKFLDNKTHAQAGENIGITIESPSFIKRGDIICNLDNNPPLKNEFTCKIFWLSKKDLSKNERLMIRCATQETTCKIKSMMKRIDSSSLDIIGDGVEILKHLDAGEVVIKTKKPIVVTSFNEVEELGRFVLVQNENICAGGIIS